MPERKEENLVIKNKKEIRIGLEPFLIKKLEEIKKFFGIKNTTEIIRYLIMIKHREIQEHSIKLNDMIKDTQLSKKTIEIIIKNMLKVFENHQEGVKNE